MYGRRFMKSRIQENYFRQDIKRREYIMAVVQTAAVMGTLAYLYYESVWALVVFAPLGFWYLRKWEEECLQKKKQEFQVQFQEAIQSISASLNVGYSVENAMREAKKDLDLLYAEDTVIQREFNYMLRQIHLHIPMEQIIEEWAQRAGQEDVRNFAGVFATAKKSGGDMMEIIRNAIYQIRDKLEVQREIETLLAARKYEFKVMSVIPFGIIAYMKLSFPEFMGILYGNPLGIGVMTVCLGVYAGAYWLGQKIVDIEV